MDETAHVPIRGRGTGELSMANPAVSRHDDAQRARLDGESGGELADVFAIQLQEDPGGAGEGEGGDGELAGAAELVHPPHRQAGQGRRQTEEAGFGEDTYIEQAVVEAGAGKDRHRTAVKAAVADGGPFAGQGLAGLDGDEGAILGEGLEGGEDIGEGANSS